jgi:amicyanin
MLLAGLLLSFSVFVLPPAPAEAATSHRVTIKQYAYGPSSLNVTVGDTVTWTNLDTVEHDVTVTNGPVSFRSPMLSKGQSWSYTFTTAGSYSYICSVHPDMKGSVRAAAAPVAATTHAAHPTTAPPPTQAATSAPTTTHSAGAGHSAKPHATRSAGAKAVGKAKSPTNQAQPATAIPATVEPSLNPLLFVLGGSIAVVVFCLLLMASRPVQPVGAPDPGAPEDE